MNVLIVDDDIVDRQIIRRALRLGSSDNITEATSVKEGLQALVNSRYDVVLLDFRMPEKDGLEMMHQIHSRADLDRTAVIMMSTSENEQLGLDCIEAGAQDFFTKDELTEKQLKKVIMHARKRFQLEYELKESYDRVKNMAEKDGLTGLSNRYHFEESLKVVITNNRRETQKVALLALDIDNFKFVNESIGHEKADKLLKKIVIRIQDCIRPNEGFARLGGDQFAIILGSIKTASEVSGIAHRIINALDAPFHVDNKEITCGISIGVAMYPADAHTGNELLKYAEIAMYRSKQSANSKVCFYEQQLQKQFNLRFAIQNGLKRVLQTAEFTMHYQPVFDLKTDSITSMEALIRWPSDMTPHYRPDEFIPVAEEIGLIDQVGEWVVTEVMRQSTKLQAETNTIFGVAINISPIQLQDERAAEKLISLLKQHQIQPENVMFEITETALFKDSETIKHALQKLSDFGCLIALDDFGTGFSSISHLMNYPIDVVKLDKTMLHNNGDDGKQQQKVFSALALMLKTLGFTVVAEGVETAEQLALCKQVGIDKVQGYYLAKPGPIEQIKTDFLTLK
jgi:diguanylate cyclase (GGDEF)-like protein